MIIYYYITVILEESLWSCCSVGIVAYLCQCLIKRDTPCFLQSVQEEIKSTVLTQEPTKSSHS